MKGGLFLRVLKPTPRGVLISGHRQTACDQWRPGHERALLQTVKSDYMRGNYISDGHLIRLWWWRGTKCCSTPALHLKLIILFFATTGTDDTDVSSPVNMTSLLAKRSLFIHPVVSEQPLLSGRRWRFFTLVKILIKYCTYLEQNRTYCK